MLIRIVACKEREDNISKMLSSLPKETTPIWDTDHNSCHTLCRTLDSDEAMLVMEDDIELCENFYKRAMKEIDEHPNSFVMFYSCKSWEIKEAENKANGLPYDRPFVYTQAFYLWINEFLVQEWIDRYLVQPSLVQHIWFNSIWEKRGFVMHQSKTYKYEDDTLPNK